MALFMNQENTRSELQKRIAAELNEKAKRKADFAGGDRPDGVEDSAYLENTKKTTSLGWVWLLVILLVVAGILFLVVKS